MPGKPINRVGQKYNMLTVIEQAEDQYTSSGKKHIMWKCRCDCGNETVVWGTRLANGHTKSCGCLQKKKAIETLNILNAQKQENKEQNYINQQFGNLKVLSLSDPSKARPIDYWICSCECGNTVSILHSRIRNGEITDCGCKDFRQYRFKDITGQHFGKLTAISPILDKEEQGHSKKWKCLCDCGNEVIVTTDALQKGNTMSCGCLKQSQGEFLIEQILKENNIPFEKEKYAFDYKTGGKARFDFFVDDKYVIEFDGEQHYQSNNRWWNTDEFVETQKIRDQIKNEYCKNNNIPLIRIPYTHKMKINIKDLQLETSEFIIK